MDYKKSGSISDFFLFYATYDMEVNRIMNNIDKTKHEELIEILQELIKTISLMQAIEQDYLLVQNANEAKEWLDFLNKHMDKEELKTLENEISDRFFFKFDVQIGKSELDNIRTELMKKYVFKSTEFLK